MQNLFFLFCFLWCPVLCFLCVPFVFSLIIENAGFYFSHLILASLCPWYLMVYCISSSFSAHSKLLLLTEWEQIVANSPVVSHFLACLIFGFCWIQYKFLFLDFFRRKHVWPCCFLLSPVLTVPPPIFHHSIHVWDCDGRWVVPGVNEDEVMSLLCCSNQK